MRRRLIPTTILCIVTLALLPLSARTGSDSGTRIAPSLPLEGQFVPNEILIGLRPDVAQNLAGRKMAPGRVGVASLDQISEKHAVQEISSVFTDIDLTDAVAEQYGLSGVLKLTFPAGTDILAVIREYQRDPAVAYAELNEIYKIADVPNDTDFSKQWALHNTGQTGGTADADIDAPEAWAIETGKPAVMIAIVDTGVDYNHPDLSGGRVRTDIDKDFINSDDDAMDDQGHGTYCTGIAAANTGNSRGMAGICQGCQILPVKVLNSDGSGTTETVAQGIQYAGQAGARIVSMSLGYAGECGCSQTIGRASNYAFDRGSLLIAASGNDSDKTRIGFPAASPRVMSVGATNHRDQEADFSNRSQALDILAPGEDVYSLDLNGGYRTASGTSAATPHVSGVAGLVWSARPALTNLQVWWILYHSADDMPQTSTLFEDISPTDRSERPQSAGPAFKAYLPLVSRSRTTFGRLNAYRALRLPSAGQMSAPQDDCSTEPDCPPECAAEIVLSGESAGPDYTILLRAFRDRVLAPSPIGQHWITLYQRHRFEAAWILASDGQFRAQTRGAVKQWLPLFQALTYPDSIPEQQAVLTHAQAQVLEGVIAGLIERGNSQLGFDLAEVRETLQLGRFIGWDVRDVWHELEAGR